MAHVSDAQLLILYKGFVEAKDFLMNSNMPDANKQPLMKAVNESLSIIRNAIDNKGSPTGGSTCAVTTEQKTKNLFEMFGLNRI